MMSSLLPFRSLLYILTFSFVELVSCQATTVPWIQTRLAYYVNDLVAGTVENLRIISQYWTINGVDKPSKTNVFKCGDQYFFGTLGMLTYGDFFQRTYDSLGDHNMIYYHIRFAIIDNWQPSDKLIIRIDNPYYEYTIAPSPVTPTEVTESSPPSCGNPSELDNTDFVVVGRIPHTGSSLTIQITSNLDTNSKAYGFKLVRLSMKKITGTLTARGCTHLKTTLSTTIYPDRCSCARQRYLSSSTCYSCLSDCNFCYGGTKAQCYSCINYYAFDGQNCVPCPENCQLCTGSLENQCTRCNNGYILYWNNTCKSSCDFPFITSIIGDYKTCSPPSCKSNEYVLWNGTCSESCRSPLVNRILEGITKFCDVPCQENEYYHEAYKTCKPDCKYPYKLQDNRVCILDILQEELEDLKTSTATVEVTGSFSNSIGTAVNLMNFNNPTGFFLESMMEMLTYIRYMKVNYPPRLQYMLDAEVDPLFQIVPDVPSVFVEELPRQTLPEKFELYQVPSSFFINFWETGITLIIVYVIAQISSLLEYMVVKKNKWGYRIVKKIREALKWNYALSVFTSSFGDLILYTSLELRSVHFNTALSAISFSICILSNLIAILVFLKIIKILRTLSRIKINSSKSMDEQQLDIAKNYWSKFNVIFEDYKDNKSIQQVFMCFYVGRLCIFNMIIGYLFDYPLVQTSLIFALSLSMILYIVISRPLKKLLDLIQYISQEVIMVIINMCIFILSIFDRMENENVETRRVLGDIIIYLNISFGCLGMLYFSIQTAMFLRELYLFIREFLRKRKSIKAKKLEAFDLSIEKDLSIDGPTSNFEAQLSDISTTFSNIPRLHLRLKNIDLTTGSQKSLGLIDSRIFSHSSSLNLFSEKSLKLSKYKLHNPLDPSRRIHKPKVIFNEEEEFDSVKKRRKKK